MPSHILEIYFNDLVTIGAAALVLAVEKPRVPGAPQGGLERQHLLQRGND